MVITYQVQNLKFSWKKGKEVFEKISFSLSAGEIFCILGPNGTGKSTLLRCLMNLLEPMEGQIFLGNKEITSLKRSHIAKEIAYVPQNCEIAFPFSVLEFVLMGRAPYLGSCTIPGADDITIALDALDEVGIGHLSDKKISEISGGERQMAMIARALTQKANILLLDEPTSHLDFGNQMQVLSLVERLSEKGISVIMTSHFPDHAFLISTRVAIMNKGQITAIGPAESVITSERLQETYHADVRVDYIDMALRRVCIPVRNRPGYLCSVQPSLHILKDSESQEEITACV